MPLPRLPVKKQIKKLDPETKQPIIGADGKPVTEEQEIKIPKYKVVCVYDVAQTDGKELPVLATELTGDVAQYQNFFAALEKTSPFPMEFQPLQGNAKGRCDYEGKRIYLHEGMSELQNIKTAIHEIAHATMHDLDRDAADRPDRRTREIQAESVAYAVCQHYGLDTSDYSFGYVAGWSSGRELAELRSSLETIRSTAANLIETIDGHFTALQQTQEHTAEQEQTETTTPELTETIEQPEETAQTTQAEQETQKAAAPYYTINEAAARRAKDANSFSDYKPGSATAEYRGYIDKAVELAERQKARIDLCTMRKSTACLIPTPGNWRRI